MNSLKSINKYQILLVMLILIAQKYEQGVAGIFTQGVEVAVQNYIGKDKVLYMNCSSRDDDLGKQWLRYERIFRWKFYINIWGTTKFRCYFMWQEGSLKLRGEFHIYDAGRDEVRCGESCYWRILRKGIYAYEPDEKKFKRYYRWPIPDELLQKGRGGGGRPALPSSNPKSD